MIELIRGRDVMVVGLARSGMAAVRLLAELGARKIIATDQKAASALRDELEQLNKFAGVTAVIGENRPELVTPDLSLIIKSPGVPPTLELFRRAAALQIPVLSEIELAYAFIKAPLVGITGTNGKTTTTALTAAILEEARIGPVMAAGNIGVPLCDAVGKISSSGVIVAELSSFQLENIRHFRPAAAVFLNFEEDHLDYHGTIESYFRAKVRIFENQGAGDYAILNASDAAVAALGDKVPGPVLWFGKGPLSRGAGLERDQVVLFNGAKVEPVCPRVEIALPGEHNLENALAATAAAWAMGADAAAAGRTLRRFRGIEHRLEYVACIDQVEFINDSKGTNPGAAIKALQSFPGKRKILIAGGKDKGSDFTALAAVIKEEVHHLVLLGETKEQLARAVEQAGFTRYEMAGSFAEAVAAAWSRAEPGDQVLLSPACASWDMFKDYEARGNLFKELVASLRR
ncbi:MAG: UDP-N-acetylmuramoyl-L-alanine--D-glutamate ligase [Bacillota bacterium]